MFTIAALQLKPKFKDVLYNVERATSLLRKSFQKRKFDLVVMPELTLTGYNFKSPREIEPFLESIKDFGSSINFGIETSRSFKCFTVIGYPEIYKSKIYNSSCLIAPNGSIVYNYRKSFLYETDEVWGASESQEGFTSFRLNLDKEFYYKLDQQKFENENYARYSIKMIKELDLEESQKDEEYVKSLENQYEKSFINTTIGICMDLNPYKFQAPFEDFEFANFCLLNDIDLILFPMAWLSSKSPSIRKDELPENKIQDIKYFQEQFSQISEEFVININNSDTNLIDITSMPSNTDFKKQMVDMGNINYLVLRSIPLFNSFYKINHELPMNTKNRFVVFCNRIGIEDDVLYCGSSCIIKFNNLDPLKFLETHNLNDAKLKDEFNKFQYNNLKNPSVELLNRLPIGQEGIMFNEINFSAQ